MTENEFRIMHSQIIEEYQLIEMHLKGICSVILADDARSWVDRLDGYNYDPLGFLLKEIQTIQKNNKSNYLLNDDLKALDAVRVARNYWVHQSFVNDEHVTFSRTGNVKKEKYVSKIRKDLNDAVELEEKLTGIFCKISEEKGIAESMSV